MSNLGTKLKLLAARREAADAELSRLIEEAAKKRRERMELVAELREINNKSFKAIRQEREFWRNQLKSLKKQLVGSNDDKGKESKVKMKNFDSEEWSTAAWNSDAELENLVKASKQTIMASNGLVAAAGLLVYRRTPTVQYLFLQASYPPHHWTPPKGHVDPGEDFWTAALRETQEEAGILEEQLLVHRDFCYDMRYEANGKPKQVKYWLAKLKEGEKVQLSHEHDNWQWLELDTAVKTSKFPEMEKMLREADGYLQKQQA